MEDAPPRWLKLQVPGYRLLLHRFDIEAESYTLYITDLRHVWIEFLPYQQIIQRADRTSTKTCNIDPKQSLANFRRVLEMLGKALTMKLDELSERSITLNKRKSAMTLLVKTKDPPPESLEQIYSQSQSQSHSLRSSQPEQNSLEWKFSLLPLEMSDPRYILVFQTLILGLVGVIDAQGQQISDLMTLIRKKDFHLRHLREEYHITEQPRIHREASRTFNPDEWKDGWISQREEAGEAGAADVDEILTRSMTERVPPLWGFHALGCVWRGSMVMTDQSSSPVSRDKLPEGMIPSSPPLLYNNPDEGESTASEDDVVPDMKEEPKAAYVLTFPLSSSPLHSPQKRKFPAFDSLASEPPSPSPKKRMRQFSTASSSLASDLDSKRRPAQMLPTPTLPGANTIQKSTLESSSVPTTTAVSAEKSHETELEKRKKELEARLAGKSGRASRPKRRF